MIQFAEHFAWCILQVTLFAATAAVIYGFVARRRTTGNVWLLAVCFAVIAVLTLTSASPLPSWRITPRLDSKTTVITADAPQGVDALPGSYTAEPTNAADSTTLSNVRSPDNSPRSLELLFDARPWWFWLVVGAFAMSAIGAARFALGYAYVRQLRLGSRTIDGDDILREFDELRAALHAPSNVELRESPSLGAAATFGWHRPVVLLPAEWRDWSHDERRAVLAHELAHVVERHFPVWIASQLTTVLHFYHPLVHWLGRRLRLEQELAADELAARTFGRRDKYAAVLASLAIGKPQPAAVVGLGLFMSRPLLMRRITMLRETTEHRRPSRLVRASAILLLASSAIAIAGLRATTTAAQKPDDTPSDGFATEDSFKTVPDFKAVPDIASEEKPPQSETGSTRPDGPPPDAYAPARQLSLDSQRKPTDSRYVTALIQISRHPITYAAGPDRSLDSDAEWQVYRQTQLAYLQSHFQLQAALRAPEVAQLDLIKSQADPVRWLSDQLDVSFINASEIMYVRLNSSLGKPEELAKIVDAVVRTYMSAVVDAERARRDALRAAMAKSVGRLNNEVRSKTEQMQDLSRELGVANGATRDAQSELLLRELTELSRTKSELEGKLAELQANYMIAEQRSDLLGENAKATRKEFQIRAGLLNQQLMTITKEIEDRSDAFIARGQESVDLRLRQVELDQLQKIAAEMSLQLEKMDIERTLPDRVRVIQWAM